MKIKKILTTVLSLILVFSLSSCSGGRGTKMTMEMTGNYDDSDPFINEKLIYVSENIDTLDLDVTFKMKGESGMLEIVDRETEQVFYSNTWKEHVDKTKFTVSLDNLEKEKEYTIRFTGTKMTYAKIVITSDNSLLKEKIKPLKPNKPNKPNK